MGEPLAYEHVEKPPAREQFFDPTTSWPNCWLILADGDLWRPNTLSERASWKASLKSQVSICKACGINIRMSSFMLKNNMNEYEWTTYRWARHSMANKGIIRSFLSIDNMKCPRIRITAPFYPSMPWNWDLNLIDRVSNETNWNDEFWSLDHWHLCHLPCRWRSVHSHGVPWPPQSMWFPTPIAAHGTTMWRPSFRAWTDGSWLRQSMVDNGWWGFYYMFYSFHDSQFVL